MVMRFAELQLVVAKTTAHFARAGAYFTSKQRLAIVSEATSCLDACPGCTSIEELTKTSAEFLSAHSKTKHNS